MCAFNIGVDSREWKRIDFDLRAVIYDIVEITNILAFWKVMEGWMRIFISLLLKTKMEQNVVFMD